MMSNQGKTVSAVLSILYAIVQMLHRRIQIYQNIATESFFFSEWPFVLRVLENVDDRFLNGQNVFCHCD